MRFDRGRRCAIERKNLNMSFKCSQGSALVAVALLGQWILLRCFKYLQIELQRSVLRINTAKEEDFSASILWKSTG